jgi:hypothetical protein
VPTRPADHADYRITFHPSGKADAGPLVVTFGGQPSGLGDSGFGTDFCARNGWDHIHVAQRSATQFQGLDLEAFETATAELARGRDVVCHGASLCGYAAFCHGGCLNARIIAAAPMLPLWPPMRYRAFADVPYLHRPLEDCPRSSALPVIIVDPLLRRDMFFVEQMILPVHLAARIVSAAIRACASCRRCARSCARRGSRSGTAEGAAVSPSCPAGSHRSGRRARPVRRGLRCARAHRPPRGCGRA